MPVPVGVEGDGDVVAVEVSTLMRASPATRRFGVAVNVRSQRALSVSAAKLRAIMPPT